MFKIFVTITVLISSLTSYSQEVNQSELSKTFHESGKINVVIAIISVIFIGIIIFLIRTDRKINKLEKEIGNN